MHCEDLSIGIPVEEFSKFDLYESVYLVGEEICAHYFC